MKTSKTDFHNDFHNLRLHLQDYDLYMPAEFKRHEGTFLIWPVRPGSWPHGGAPAKEAICKIARLLLKEEDVHLTVDREHEAEARAYFSEESSDTFGSGKLFFHIIPTDDAWVRDTGPIVVYDKKSGRRVGLDFGFNAWGGSYNGLYKDYENDAEVSNRLCHDLGLDVIHLREFILEGGSIHTDGEGTLLTTEACLLSHGRNPHLSKGEIEELLCLSFGCRKVLWLPNGIYGDETDEHVDNMCAFLRPGTVALAWCEDETDPQYAYSRRAYEYLSKERDAKGRKLEIVLLPIPKEPIRITEEDMKGYSFSPGEAEREVGERLSASYVNFYFANNKLLLPQFGDENDEKAVAILSEKLPEFEVCPVSTLSLLKGGGNIHCLTLQLPVGMGM